MPDFTNVSGWDVQQLANLEAGGYAFPAVGGGVPNSLLAQTFDPILAVSDAPVATETMVGVLTFVAEPVYTSKVMLETITSAASHAFAAIIDMAGNIVAATADFESSWDTTTLLTLDWVTAITLHPGLYYFAVQVEGSSPTVAGIIPSSVAANANTSGAAGNLRCATLATGGTTALPSSPITLTDASAVASAPWIGIL